MVTSDPRHNGGLEAIANPMADLAMVEFMANDDGSGNDGITMEAGSAVPEALRLGASEFRIEEPQERAQLGSPKFTLRLQLTETKNIGP